MKKNKLDQMINANEAIEDHLKAIEKVVDELCENIPQDALLYTPISFHVEWIRLNNIAIKGQLMMKKVWWGRYRSRVRMGKTNKKWKR